MADLFSLAPEGQAWVNADIENNAAKPEDYDPTWYAGSGSAFFRGAAEGTVGLAQTGVEMAKLSPTYSALRGEFPELDEVVDQNFNALQKSLNDARNAVKPAASSQGIAAEVLEGLGVFAPAIGATVLGGPAAGGAVAFGSTYEPTRQDFLGKGVDADTAGTLALEQAGANALGMALPAGVGKTLATRLLSGVGINAGFGAANRFSTGETLEENGYSELAKQYRVWDKQAIIVDSVLGAAFGGVHHVLSSRSAEGQPTPAPPEQGEPVSTGQQPGTQEGQGLQGGEPVNDQSVVSTDLTDGQPPKQTYDSRISELTELSGQLLSRGDRQNISKEIHDLQYQFDQASSLLQRLKDQPVAGSGKALAQGRAERTRQVNEADTRMGMLKEQIDQRNTVLAQNSPGGQFYDARADLSRIQQGIIPESMRGLIDETPVRPSDVDAAHVMNEGLHYDLESSPIIHADNGSINSHVAAMDQASRQLMSGDPVDVAAQVSGLDGIARPDAIASGEAQRASMEDLYRENGLVESVRDAPAQEVPPVRGDSAFGGARQVEASAPEQVSTNPDTGEALSSNSFDLMAARDMSQSNPDLMVSHPDTGEQVSLAQALADLDNQIVTAQKESNVYSVAATCFLRNS